MTDNKIDWYKDEYGNESYISEIPKHDKKSKQRLRKYLKGEKNG